MPAELILVPEAARDVADAYAWYEDRGVGLGEQFLSCVEACLEAIRRMPDGQAIVHESYRRGLLRRFPYVIFYEYAENTVTIYGVFHTSRAPDQWRQRLP